MRYHRPMHTRVTTVVAAAFLAAALPAAAQTALAPIEQRIVSHVEAHNAEALALVERAVNINSGTQNHAGVRQVGELFLKEFQALGFETRWVDGAAFNRAGHLVAERAGNGPKVLLIGHLDTVFEPDSPFQKYEVVDATHARGPGTTDMKGGNVIIVHALKALKAVGLLDNLHIVVVMTGDEEEAGRPLSRSRAALVEAAQGAAVAIGFEDGDGNPKTAVIARRGTTSWTLTVKGKPAHSSQIFKPEIGAGAIFEAARILDAFRERLAGQEHLTFNPGVIVGGTSMDYDAAGARGSAFGKSNVIAEHVLVSGDLRALSPEQFEAAREAMAEIVSTSLPHTSAEITFGEGYPPLAPAPGNYELLKMYDQASRDLGFGPVEAVNPDNAGAADVSFVAGHVPMIMDGVGLMGDGGHTVRETADLATLPMQTKRAAVTLARIAGMQK